MRTSRQQLDAANLVLGCTDAASVSAIAKKMHTSGVTLCKKLSAARVTATINKTTFASESRAFEVMRNGREAAPKTPPSAPMDAGDPSIYKRIDALAEEVSGFSEQLQHVRAELRTLAGTVQRVEDEVAKIRVTQLSMQDGMGKQAGDIEALAALMDEIQKSILSLNGGRPNETTNQQGETK